MVGLMLELRTNWSGDGYFHDKIDDRQCELLDLAEEENNGFFVAAL
jgi:hypothetical protein